MSKPLNVTIVILGYADSLFDVDLLKKHRSNIFRVCDVHTKRILPSPNQSYGTLNIEYSFHDIDNMLKDVKGDFVVGIIDYPMQNGFFGRQAGDKKFCLSIRNPRFILENSNICIENFILKSIYKFILHTVSNQRSHRDTRRCIFDLNGDLRDIVLNTEKAIICNECKAKLEKLNLPQDYITLFEKELLHIDKDVMKKVELWLQSHVYIAMLLSGIASLLISILANILYQLFAV